MHGESGGAALDLETQVSSGCLICCRLPSLAENLYSGDAQSPTRKHSYCIVWEIKLLFSHKVSEVEVVPVPEVGGSILVLL